MGVGSLERSSARQARPVCSGARGRVRQDDLATFKCREVSTPWSSPRSSSDSQLFVTLLLAIVPQPVPAHLLDEMGRVRHGFVQTTNEMAKHGRNFILKMIFKIIKVLSP